MLRRVGIVVLGVFVLAGCVRVRWTSSGDWDHFEVMPVSKPTNTVELSVGTPEAQTGRITEFGPEGNDRRWWVAKGEIDRDSDMRVLWRGHRKWLDGGGQMGQVMRAQTLPDGTNTGYVVWHDVVFAQDQIIHAAVWFGNPATDRNDRIYIGQTSFDFLKKKYDVVSATRSAGVATLTVLPGHVVDVGDALVVDVGDPSFDGIARVTAVSSTTIQYFSAGPDTLLGGVGTIDDLDAVLPYWVRTRLVGTTLSVKVWPEAEDEPAWDDATHVSVFEDTGHVGPTGPGRDGVYAGHIANGGFVDFGPLDIKSLDAAPAAPAAPAAASPGA